MINFDVTKENKKEHNPNWPKTPDHPYKILMIGGSRFGKTNSLFNLINHQPDIDNIFLYAKYLNEAKYGFLIKKRKNVGTSISMILKLILNTQMIWMVFIKTLKNTI